MEAEEDGKRWVEAEEDGGCILLQLTIDALTSWYLPSSVISPPPRPSPSSSSSPLLSVCKPLLNTRRLKDDIKQDSHCFQFIGILL